MKIVALDFETADRGPDSACALAMVAVENGIISDSTRILIRPPRRIFEFSYLHGITWSDVETEPSFAEHIPEIDKFIKNSSHLIAHNAVFDRMVLYNCYSASGYGYPRIPFSCTVRLARNAWQVFPTKLPDVCRYLKIRLKHHDPLSDALACARIAIAAQDAGVSIQAGLLGPHTYTLLPLDSSARPASTESHHSKTPISTGKQRGAGSRPPKQRTDFNKEDLVAAVSADTGISKTDGARAVEAVLASISNALKNGNEVRLTGFGTFGVVHRNASEGRNTRTGARIQFPASNHPIFKPAKTLRNAIN
jgi:DNA polymerase-3 subunit epsilon